MLAPTLIPQFTDLRLVQGSRSPCWRADCRRASGEYRTVSYLPGNVAVAHCHGATYRTLFDLLVELWAHAG